MGYCSNSIWILSAVYYILANSTGSVLLATDRLFSFLFCAPVERRLCSYDYGCQCGLLTDCCRLITDYFRQPCCWGTCQAWCFSSHLLTCSMLNRWMLFRVLRHRQVESFFKTQLRRKQTICVFYNHKTDSTCCLLVFECFLHREPFQWVKCCAFDQLIPSEATLNEPKWLISGRK